jgi:hypothetical protein
MNNELKNIKNNEDYKKIVIENQNLQKQLDRAKSKILHLEEELSGNAEMVKDLENARDEDGSEKYELQCQINELREQLDLKLSALYCKEIDEIDSILREIFTTANSEEENKSQTIRKLLKELFNRISKMVGIDATAGLGDEHIQEMRNKISLQEQEIQELNNNIKNEVEKVNIINQDQTIRRSKQCS